MRTLLVCLALVTLTACDSAGGASRLELVIDRTQFTAGDEALVVLDNDTGRDQPYGPCPVLVRFDGARRFEPVGEGAACLDILLSIRAGQSIPFRVALPGDLEIGTYAVALPAGDEGSVPGIGRELPILLSGRFEVVE